MKIAVYEHFTVSRDVYTPVWLEGSAMLAAAVEDLKADGHEVYIVDSIPPAKPVDLVIAIAPSAGRKLYSVVKSCEEEGLNVLNAPSSAVFLASDKALLAKHLQYHDIKTPPTLIFTFEDGLDGILQALRDYGKVVVKPADGDGCMGLSIIEAPGEAQQALRKVKQQTKLPYFVVQEYVEGTNVSVNVLAIGGEVALLSVNLQNISLRTPPENSLFIGNVVPYVGKSDVAVDLALKTIKSLGRADGFFGVDMILRGGEAFVVEINPRLTVSYLALREVSTSNVLGMMVKAYFGGCNIQPPRIEGMAIVEKLVAEDEKILKMEDLKIPVEAKLLSTAVGKRSMVKKGEVYAIYVLKSRIPQ